MLERPGLLLCPWGWAAPAAPTPQGRPEVLADPGPQSRQILDLDTHEFLGLVRKVPARAWPVFRWLCRPVWQVLETEDESLLLTLYGPWGLARLWELHDAEDRLVCSMSGTEVYDAAGYLCVRVAGQAGQTRFLSKDKTELATLVQGPDGVELRFASAIDPDPYTKMALLGTTLTLSASKIEGKTAAKFTETEKKPGKTQR